MVTVTIANFLALLLSFCGRIVRKEHLFFLLAIIFCILFYSIRSDYGNDLPGYIEAFNNISFFSSDLSDSNIHYEPGWIILNLLFSNLGWQPLLIFLTIIQFGTVYWLITKYVEPSKYWLIFSFYVLSASLLLTSLSMLRQALAMHISCWAVPYVLKKSYLKSIPILILATTIHTSAFAVFPILLLPFIINIRPKIVAIIYVSLFIILMVADSMVSDLFKIVLQSATFEKFDIYEGEQSEKGSGLGILLQLLLSLWLLLRYSKQKAQYFFNLTLCLSVMMTPFVMLIPLVGRISMYFLLMGIISLQTLTNFKKDPIGMILLLINLYIAFSGYFSFFESPIWKNAYSVYHTIFE